MITLQDYWMGRDVEYAAALNADIRHHAAITIERVNKLLVLAKTGGVSLEIHPRTRSLVSSGWRSPAVNAATPGAAPRSKHMTGQALDVYDPDGDIDEWALANPKILADLGLWQEHPSATKSWAHFQTVAPRSGNRVFYP